jgi:hypothetical protein
MNKDIDLQLLVGKTIAKIDIVSKPEQDIDIYFTDGTKLLVRCIGDDMSYTHFSVPTTS